MRRIVTIILSTVATLVLLLSYHTSTDSATVAASPVVQTPTPTSTASPAPTSPSATTPSATTPSATTPSATTPSATYKGDVVQTQWGAVQVQISVRAGKITASEAVQYPQENHRDVEINSYAVPILNQEVVEQQSASIDSVSGATVTSDGYLQSLQSAIDQANL